MWYTNEGVGGGKRKGAEGFRCCSYGVVFVVVNFVVVVFVVVVVIVVVTGCGGGDVGSNFGASVCGKVNERILATGAVW